MRIGRILVCGGRDYPHKEKVFDALGLVCGGLYPEPVIISGGARGVDQFAAEYAAMCCYEYIEFRANWCEYGKASGPIRNQRMLDECKPDIVMAFPGGNGTRDMVNRARLAGIPVNEYKENEQGELF